MTRRPTDILMLTMAVVMFAAASPALQAAERSAAKTAGETYGEQLGTVRLPASCGEAADRHLERGLALLHHMTYEGARASFEAATESDPECALGYWGRAMTRIHPLWSDPPTEEAFEGAPLLRCIFQSRTRDCRTRRCSEREPADSLRDKYNVRDGWLPSLTFAFGEVARHVPDARRDSRRAAAIGFTSSAGLAASCA